MFGRPKTKTETPAAPERVVISLEEEARLEWKAAETELAAASGKLQEFVTENFRMAAGGLIYLTKENNRDLLDAQLQALTVDVDVARATFHAACAAWSQLKEDRTMMTNANPTFCPADSL